MYIVNEKQKRLIFLIGKIPNWEFYLTDKQLECIKSYVSNLDCTLVDDKLNLSRGTTNARLFGGSTSLGALGKLEKIYDKLAKKGYWNKKDITNKQSTKKILSEETIEKTKQLFFLIENIENYNDFLSGLQQQRLNYFLQYRSFKKCAKEFNITESSVKQYFLGKKGHSSILDILQKHYDNTTINNWEDI